MSPSPSSRLPKPIHITFSGGQTYDSVTITNNTTGRRVTTDHKGDLLRLEGKKKSILYDMNNMEGGWAVGDVITISIGGVDAGTAVITLTAATNIPQTATATATAVSTTALTI